MMYHRDRFGGLFLSIIVECVCDLVMGLICVVQDGKRMAFEMNSYLLGVIVSCCRRAGELYVSFSRQ